MGDKDYKEISKKLEQIEFNNLNLSDTWDDKMALAASADSVNTTYEAGRSYLAPLRLSGQKKV